MSAIQRLMPTSPRYGWPWATRQHRDQLDVRMQILERELPLATVIPGHEHLPQLAEGVLGQAGSRVVRDKKRRPANGTAFT